jgi:hypothetical protein
MSQSETPNHVRGDGSFPRRRSSGVGDGCIADRCQPSLQFGDGTCSNSGPQAGDRGICNGPQAASRAAKSMALIPAPEPMAVVALLITAPGAITRSVMLPGSPQSSMKLYELSSCSICPESRSDRAKRLIRAAGAAFGSACFQLGVSLQSGG